MPLSLDYFRVDGKLLYVKWIYLLAYLTIAPATNFLPLFYRYIGFNPSLIGIILSLPSLFGLTAPFWGTLTDRYVIHKQAFLAGWTVYILSNSAIYFLSYLPHPPYPGFYNRSSCEDTSLNLSEVNGTEIEKQANMTQFWLYLLVCVPLASLFVQPALLLIDTAALNTLGESSEHYGKQRLWGSVGFGVGSVVTGNAISYFCNINMLFYILMFFGSLLLVSIVPFPIRIEPIALSATTSDVLTSASESEHAHSSKSEQRNSDSGSSGSRDSRAEGEASDQSSNSEENADAISASSESWSEGAAGIVAVDQQQRFWEDLKVIIKWKNLPLIYVVFAMGAGHGVLETIVWLFVKDIGGNEDLIGYALLTMCTSEVFFFFFSDLIISKFGSAQALYFSLICFLLRFIYYHFLHNPWTVFPAELLHGVVWGLAWSSIVVIATEATPRSLISTMQGVLRAVMMIGHAFGALIGGVAMHRLGARMAFLLTSAWLGSGCIVYFVLNRLFAAVIAEPVLEENIRLDNLADREDADEKDSDSTESLETSEISISSESQED